MKNSTTLASLTLITMGGQLLASYNGEDASKYFIATCIFAVGYFIVSAIEKREVIINIVNNDSSKRIFHEAD